MISFALMGQKGNQFSTFAGVFTPSILTVLGAIMFLRAGYVVGEAGILNAILILCAAEVISLLTAVSMSAIATNTPVAGGGAYFLISRALGPQFGGAIGLALFLAQALSVPFYILAFTNSVVLRFSILAPWFLAIALGAATVLFVINLISSGAAIRAQYIVMTLLALAIASFLGGALVRFDPAMFQANLGPSYSKPTIGFWVVFAIYFPAVTGILAGVNMSGDLKDPPRSLVRGTMAAIAVGFLIYLLQMILCGGSQPRTDLLERPFEMLVDSALLGTGFLVVGGVFAATISSAVGSYLGAPRVLQALARDRIFPILGVFGRGSKAKDEPRLGLALTLVLTFGVILLASGGDSMAAFDLIAAIVTMFFLCTYGMINLAAFVESFGANPSFRPRFRFYHWTTSLLGFAMCLGVMILIDAIVASVAALIIAGIYAFLSRRVFRSAFGDARRGFQYALAVRTLQKLRRMTPHAKNWRPTFLVMAGNTQTHMTLIKYAVWMEGGRGLVTAAQVFSGDLQTFAARVESLRSAMETFLQDNALAVFPEVVFAEDVDEGIRTLAQAHSIGPLKPNTVLFGWPRSEQRADVMIRHVWSIAGLGKSVVIVVDKGLPSEDGHQRRIDIWWRGQENGSLMATLGHLLAQNWEWRDSRIRILRVIKDAAGRESSRQAVRKLVEAARIRAEPRVIVSAEPFSEVFRSHSAKADVVFLGLQPAEDESGGHLYRRVSELLTDMPTTILVHSSGEADLFA
ncbi:MAG TPA: amino acid permease [Sedimentisphaerales bacterium]|nr:amino acid permease [Sedimentisphaerales bacterium]